jgi:hypothetical protein
MMIRKLKILQNNKNKKIKWIADYLILKNLSMNQNSDLTYSYQTVDLLN